VYVAGAVCSQWGFHSRASDAILSCPFYSSGRVDDSVAVCTEPQVVVAASGGDVVGVVVMTEVPAGAGLTTLSSLSWL
jgi:hypothetical protein